MKNNNNKKNYKYYNLLNINICKKLLKGFKKNLKEYQVLI